MLDALLFIFKVALALVAIGAVAMLIADLLFRLLQKMWRS